MKQFLKDGTIVGSIDGDAPIAAVLRALRDGDVNELTIATSALPDDGRSLIECVADALSEASATSVGYRVGEGAVRFEGEVISWRWGIDPGRGMVFGCAIDGLGLCSAVDNDRGCTGIPIASQWPRGAADAPKWAPPLGWLRQRRD